MLGACAQIPIVVVPAQSDYDRTLSHARQNVDAGNYWAADRLLEEFVRTHPGTKEAQEIAFWKAAYMVDPANNLGSLAGGIAALDSYLASDSSGWYRIEATVLRRTAAAAQGPSVNLTATGASASTTATTDTVVVVSKSREDEIASLKDQLAKSKEELAKVSAELERIKKRLANPSN
jgi:TolA-binding protein